VDSPLAVETTGVYRHHPEVWDAETGAFLQQTESSDPFGFPRMHYTRTRKESMKLNEMKGPAVIISASGMAEHGRIVHHLRHNIEDGRNTILFVGFQAEHTLGRRLVEGMSTVRFFGTEHTVKAQVEKIDGLSAHADRDELLEWAEGFTRRPENTFIVHGEEASALALGRALTDRGFSSVHVPVPDESRTIE
jgi:metallo-beta-lactamase family protein